MSSVSVKILHLFHSAAFVVPDLARIESDSIESKSYFLVYDKPYLGKNSDRVQSVSIDSASLQSIVDEAKKFDYVFVYNLNYHKAFIVNRLPPHVKVVWRFYGVELYGNPDFDWQIFSAKTKAAAGYDIWYYLRKKRIAFTDYIKYMLKGLVTPNVEIKKAIQRINFFAWFNEGEYQFLCKRYNGKLPPFIKYPHLQNLFEVDLNKPKANSIVVGNSGVPEANHIDVLDILKVVNYSGLVVLPLSYGGNPVYKKNLADYIASSGLQTKTLSDFVPYEEYVSLIAGSSAAVYNSYRQMAQQNILAMLFNGVKVYLNALNPTFHMLKSEGFHVFDLEKDLPKDVMDNNIELQTNQKTDNRNAFLAMANPEYKEQFVQKILEIKR